jgi:hypothetical protein
MRAWLAIVFALMATPVFAQTRPLPIGPGGAIGTAPWTMGPATTSQPTTIGPGGAGGGGISGPFITIAGPTSGLVNVASTTFTGTLHGASFNGTTNTVTINDGGHAGTFTPGTAGAGTTTITPAAGTTFTFTYTPAVVLALTLPFTNNFSAANLGSPLPYNSQNSYTITPTTASGFVGVASANFTITLGSGTFNGTQTISLQDGSSGGTWAPSAGGTASCGSGCLTVTPPAASSSFTATYTSAVAAVLTLTAGNGQSWPVPTSVTYTSTQRSYTLTPPSQSGTVGVPSANYTVTLGAGTFNGSQSITLRDADGGTFAPSASFASCGSGCVTVTPAAAATSFTFTYTAIAAITYTLTPTNAQSWNNPTAATFIASSGGACTSNLVLDYSQSCNLIAQAWGQ